MLRLIDANLDRLGEGLRVIEDVARFLLDDAALSRQLKTLRHRLQKIVHPLEPGLLAARNVKGDVGAPFRPRAEAKHRDLPALVTANARRVQESLRVLEEFARLPHNPLPATPADLARARFQVYELEQTLVARLLRRDKASRLTGLYVVLDTAALAGRDPVLVAAQAIRGGATTIQLRDKAHARGEIVNLARKLRVVCGEGGALFIVNDYLDVALAADADGLHLGQEDLPLQEARRLMPMDRLLGCSTHTMSQARRAQSEGADYVAVGSVYASPSKSDSMVIGLETLRKVREKVSLPVIAIGGINADNVAEVMSTGVDAVAVISAVMGAEDPEEAARELVERASGIRMTESGDGEKQL
ncbi:MAG: thiamine phosphate synthase [Chloroflexi bacterium]|nr:MAG: thiamine phosphate synthase [Chloroflexota bacterium]